MELATALSTWSGLFDAEISEPDTLQTVLFMKGVRLSVSLMRLYFCGKLRSSTRKIGQTTVPRACLAGFNS